MDKPRLRQLKELERQLKFKFRKRDLLNQALIHCSYNGHHKTKEAGNKKISGKKVLTANEELEFLGDAVLELIVSEYFYKQYPSSGEGKLSKLRANIVNRKVLYPKALSLNLGNFLLLSRSEEKSGARKRSGLLADVLEALIGAVYIDGGFRKAKRFILQHFKEELEKVDQLRYFRDYKSLLQEYVQRQHKVIPYYRVVSLEGPEHRRIFSVSVKINSEIYGNGKGLSKKEAEQEAAKAAFEKLKNSRRKDEK